MTGTRYPAKIDVFPEMFETSPEENSGQWWNQLFNAIESMQGELGTDPQGSTADLEAFLDVNLQGDGEFLAFDFGTVTGTPTVASPATITFGKTFSSAPYVFVSCLSDMADANVGVICGTHTRTTTSCQLVTKRRNGGTPTSSATYHYWAIDGSVVTTLS